MRSKTYRPHLSTAQDARAVRTRAALRDALLSLLASTALDRVTIRDIAGAAGVSYTTFFRHYPTREALLDDVAAEEIRRLVALTLPVMDGRSVQEASAALFAYVRDNRVLWSTLLTGGAGPTLRSELLRTSLELAQERPAPGRAWPPPEVATLLIVSGTIELLAWWLRQGAKLPSAKVAEIHYRFVMRPIVQAIGIPARLRAKPRRKVAKR